MERNTTYIIISIALLAGMVGTVAYKVHENHVQLQMEEQAKQDAAERAAILIADIEKQLTKNMIDSNYQSCLEHAYRSYQYEWATECVKSKFTYNLDCRLPSADLHDKRYVEDKRECQVTWQHQTENPSQVTPYKKPNYQKYCIAKPGISGKIKLTPDNSTCVTATEEQLEVLRKNIRDLIRAQATWE